MNWYIRFSVALGLLLYIPLCLQVWRGTVKQNLVSWILWCTLDGIVAVALFVQGGNYALPLTYTVGCLITIFCILHHKECRWTWFEKIIVVMVLVCLVIWYFSGSRMATIATTMAVVLAGLPLLADSFRDPHRAPLQIFMGYAVVNLLSTMGGKEWSVEERLYPFANFLYCALLVLATSRRLWMTEGVRVARC